jgi:hypothetical protein
MINNYRSLIYILFPIVPLVITTIAFPTQAEIPPGSYDKLRISAEEALIIKVVKVKTQLTSNREFTSVAVKAQVVAVQRSKKGIKPGSEIMIQYESRNPNSNMPGPRRIAILKEGEYYPAFLNIADDKKNYTPAAYGESFKMTPVE